MPEFPPPPGVAGPFTPVPLLAAAEPLASACASTPARAREGTDEPGLLHTGDDLGAYVIGALDSEEGATMRRHLAVCPACRTDYEDLPALGRR